MDDFPILSLNDEGEVITEVKKETPWKKIAIIIGIILLILISLIVIIIIIINSKNNDNKKEDDKKDDKKDDEKDDDKKDISYIGEIICIYDVFSNERPTEILSKYFENKNKFDLYLENKKIPISTEIIFPKFGNIEVRYALIEDINMDNMFKDVSTLLSVKMISNKNAKILSVENAFENCENLEEISISGFDTNQIKSLKNLLYNTKISSITDLNITTNNVEDMS